MKKAKPVLFVVLAGILWGMSCIAVNILSEYSVTSIEMGFLRMACCVICMFIAMLIYKPSLFRIYIKDIWMFVGTGVFSLTFFNFCYYNTIIESEASVAVSLLYTAPVWVMLLSALLFKERITWQKIIAMCLTVFGCTLVTGLIGSAVRLSFKVLITGLGSGLGYALYTIFGRYATKKYNTITITFYTFLLSTVSYGFMVKPTVLMEKCTQNPVILPISCFAGIICGALPYVFYTIGLKKLEPSTASILAATEPIVAALIGIFAFKDTVTVSKIAGIVLILVAMILPNIEMKKHKRLSKT